MGAGDHDVCSCSCGLYLEQVHVAQTDVSAPPLPQAVATEFQNESAAALAAAATRHLQEAEQARSGGAEHW